MLKKLGFDFTHLKGDLLGGITAGIVALPLALAFGVSSGLGPAAGLYGAIFISFFASLFGGTSTQISGPTAPMTAVSMVIIAEMIASFDGEVSKALPTILLVFLIAGLLQVILGMVGIGKYIKYIPYPVVSGFMTAIGVIILITQILPAIGYSPKEDMTYVEQFKPQAEEIILDNILKEEAGEGILVLENFKETIKRAEKITPNQILQESKTLAGSESSGILGTIKVLPLALKNINWLEVLLALATIFIIYGFKRITKVIPSTLVALLVVSAVAIGFDLDYRSIQQIPSGLPDLHLDIFTGVSFEAISPYIFTAITLAFLGAIDSLLTSIVADNMTKTRHDPSQELIGQGIGNSIAAFFGGIPGAGATIRTVVNINAGGKTKLSGMVAGVLLLFVMLAMAPIASKIPAAVLAGILITVGIGVMDYKGLKAIPYMPRAEVFIMLVVLILSSFWNLVFAVGIGLVIASLMFMKQIGDITSEKSKVTNLVDDEMWDDEIGLPAELKEEVAIKHIHGPLFFGSTNDLQKLAAKISDASSTVVIRMGRIPYMDQSGLYAMEDIVSDLISDDKVVLLVNPNEQPRYMMENIDIIPDLVPTDQIFTDFASCLAWIKAHVKDEYNAKGRKNQKA